MYNNRICYEREILKSQKRHRNRIHEIHGRKKNTKAVGFDNSSPKVHLHLVHNNKKKKEYEFKLMQIEKENNHLTEKVRKINELKLQQSSSESMRFLPGIRLGAGQTPIVDCYLTKDTPTRGSAVVKGSLNVHARQREHEKIAAENANLYMRLQKQNGCYDRQKWEKEQKDREVNMKLMERKMTVGHLPQNNATFIKHRESQDKRPSTTHGGYTQENNQPSLLGGVKSMKSTRKMSMSVRGEVATHHVEKSNCLLMQAQTIMGVQYSFMEARIDDVDPTGVLIKGFECYRIDAVVEGTNRRGSIVFEPSDMMLLAEKAHVKSARKRLAVIRPIFDLGYVPRVTTLINSEELSSICMYIIHNISVALRGKQVLAISIHAYQSQSSLTMEKNSIRAATKIQAIVRGRIARLHIKSLLDQHRLATRIQARTRGNHDRIMFQKRQEQAIKIQKLYRGHYDRANLVPTTLASVDETQVIPDKSSRLHDETLSATKIQAILRGRIARQARAEKQKNAIRIQAIARGRQTRIHLIDH